MYSVILEDIRQPYNLSFIKLKTFIWFLRVEIYIGEKVE